MIGELITQLALLSVALTRLSVALAAGEPAIEPPRPPAEVFMAEVTAYTSSPDETDDTPDITASGTSTRSGIAACPRRYPFGTLVEINHETYNCQDRLAPRFDARFDIWMEHKHEAIIFGKQTLEVRVLEARGKEIAKQ